MKTRPFNLEQALAGKPVITERDQPGIYLTDTKSWGVTRYWFKLKVNNGKDDAVDKYDENGYSANTGSQLLMVCEEKEYWIATGVSIRSNQIISSCLKASEKLAILDVKNNSEYLDHSTIQTHKIIRYE